MTSYTAAQIYQNIRGGPGTSALINAGDVARKQMDLQQELNRRVAQLANSMNAAWSGDASNQAQTGAGPMAKAAADASDALNVHQRVVNQQAEAFGKVYWAVNNVPPTAPSHSLAHNLTFGLANTSQDAKVAQYQADAEANIRAYDEYMAASSENAVTMPVEYGYIPADNATISVYAPGSTGGGGPVYRGVVNPSAAGGYSGAAAGYGAAGEYVSPSSAGLGEGRFGPAGLVPGAVGGWSAEGEGFGMAGEFGGAGGIGDATAARGVGGAGSAGVHNAPNRSMVGSGANSATVNEVGIRGPVPVEGPMGTSGPMGIGRGAGGADDDEHHSATYLQEADPDSLFGVDQMTAPPVIGE